MNSYQTVTDHFLPKLTTFAVLITRKVWHNQTNSIKQRFKKCILFATKKVLFEIEGLIWGSLMITFLDVCFSFLPDKHYIWSKIIFRQTNIWDLWLLAGKRFLPLYLSKQSASSCFYSITFYLNIIFHTELGRSPACTGMWFL